VFVSRVKVYKFRNLADQQVELSPGAVFITGLNGNGKTNLLEAIYLLTGSRSFRTNSSAELARFGDRECSIFGSVTHKSGTEELGLIFTPGERAAQLNGNPLPSITELLGRLRAVAFSPADLQLAKGAPAGRRKFLDRHMVDLQPGYLSTLMAYQRALASKSALLKQQGTSYQQLLPWNEVLAEHGGKIVDNRLNFIRSLSDKAASFHHEYAPTDGDLVLSLDSDLVREGSSSTEVILEQLERASQREIALRSPLVGPHRDDLKISIGGVDCRAYASQGQTRSVVLSMKLGVIELIESLTGEAPVVLLDDVDSELDAGRSERLFTALLSKPRQIIVTGTAAPSEKFAQVPNLQVLRVERGVVAVSQ
jgi:DNA replication and repair protein RecF